MWTPDPPAQYAPPPVTENTVGEPEVTFTVCTAEQPIDGTV